MVKSTGTRSIFCYPRILIDSFIEGSHAIGHGYIAQGHRVGGDGQRGSGNRGRGNRGRGNRGRGNRGRGNRGRDSTVNRSQNVIVISDDEETNEDN
uniref:Uncharacterized protein n=1 Tax=Meloidogyne javanica TaxID=6303 RepID=A0A915N027_MELJA